MFTLQHLATISICLMLQVDHEDKQNAALNAFNELWKSKFAEDSLLVFSTGRSLALYNELRVCSKLSSAHVISGMLCHVKTPESPLHGCSMGCKQAMTAQHMSCTEGALGNPNIQPTHRHAVCQQLRPFLA